MREVRSHRQLLGWIAALAILLATLAPSLGHALAAGNRTHWIEVCTTQGSQWLAADDEGSERAPAPAHVLEHCPACSLHAPALGLPPASASALMPSWLTHGVPLAVLVTPRTLHAWVSAQPRAPPLFT